MKLRRLLLPPLLAALSGIALSYGAMNPARADSPSVSYELAMPRPADHVFTVALKIRGLARNETVLQMPIWIPGYYANAQYGRNILRFEAHDASGRALAFRQQGQSTRIIDTAGISSLTASYDLYANRPADVGTQLAMQRAEINGAGAYMYLKNQDGYPAPGSVSLTIHRPRGWDMVSGLLAMRTGDDVYTAPSYDVLADCPTELAPHFEKSDFSVNGILYHLSVDGAGTYDMKALTSVAKSVVASEVKMMGRPGYKEYWAMFETVDLGGMEHLNSSISGLPAFGWEKTRSRDDADWDTHPMNAFALVLAHEHFHSWNVKRIRPAVLGPFRYDQEVHTRRLDVAEGLTEYYTYVHALRSGYASPAGAWSLFAGDLKTEETTVGRRLLSLGDLSWNTWWPNDDPWIPANDYYDGAAIMGLMLDLKIRHDTQGRHSLDDVLRYLFHDWEAKAVDQFRSTGGTYGDDEMPNIITKATGDAEAGTLFHRWWDTVELPDWNTYLSYAGLRLIKRPPKSGEADLGAQWEEIGVPQGVGYKPKPIADTTWGQPTLTPDQVMIDRVKPDGPAAKAGLQQFDVIVSVAGLAATQESLPGILAAHKAGERVAVSLMRENRLINTVVTLGQATVPKNSIEERKDATVEQRRLRADFEAGRPFGAPEPR